MKTTWYCDYGNVKMLPRTTNSCQWTQWFKFHWPRFGVEDLKWFGPHLDTDNYRRLSCLIMSLGSNLPILTGFLPWGQIFKLNPELGQGDEAWNGVKTSVPMLIYTILKMAFGFEPCRADVGCCQKQVRRYGPQLVPISGYTTLWDWTAPKH